MSDLPSSKLDTTERGDPTKSGGNRAQGISDKSPRSHTADLVGLIETIEAAGYDWAVGRSGAWYESAIEKAPRAYIGDDMSGPGCGAGTTAYEALYSLAKERGIVRTSVDGKGSGVSQVT